MIKRFAAKSKQESLPLLWLARLPEYAGFGNPDFPATVTVPGLEGWAQRPRASAGETLDGEATIKLLEAINDIKNHPIPDRYKGSATAPN